MGRAGGDALFAQRGRAYYQEIGKLGKGKHVRPKPLTYDELMATSWRARRRAAAIAARLNATPRTAIGRERPDRKGGAPMGKD